MKIVHTIESLVESSGGPSRSVPKLVESLVKVGLSVDLLAYDYSYLDNKNIYPNIDSKHVHLCQKYNLKIFQDIFNRRFVELVKDNIRLSRPDILHDHGIWLASNRATSYVARKTNIPLVISPRGMLSSWAMSYKKLKKQICWAAYQKPNLQSANAFCATSPQEVQDIRDLGFRQPIAYIPNGVDIPSLDLNSKITDDFRWVLFLGRIHPVKGLENLVRAWDQIRPAGWKVCIAGPDEGGHRGYLEDLVSHYNLANDIKFAGHVNGQQKEMLFSSADLFVLPTHTENFGIVVAEALSFGAPVITTKGAPWASLVEKNCGWWVDIGVAPLVEALREAIALGDVHRSAMGLRGRQYVLDSYGWGKISNDMCLFYQWLLDGGTRPACVRLADE